MSDPESRWVLITGASTGIGEAAARCLAARGYRVLAGVRRPDDGERLLAQVRENLEPVLLDVTQPDSVAAARQAVVQRVGEAGLAGLINNAGIVIAGPVGLVPLDLWRQQFEVNVFGVVSVLQAFIPLVCQARGRVINVGSVAGRHSIPFLGPYSASKFALKAINDSLRLELKPFGVHVALIEPGSIATPLWDKAKATALSAQARLSPDQLAPYAEALACFQRASEDSLQRAVSPAVVVAAICHALTAPTPRRHYLPGREAQLRGLMHLLPAGWIDALVSWRLRAAGKATDPN